MKVILLLLAVLAVQAARLRKKKSQSEINVLDVPMKTPVYIKSPDGRYLGFKSERLGLFQKREEAKAWVIHKEKRGERVIMLQGDKDFLRLTHDDELKYDIDNIEWTMEGENGRVAFISCYTNRVLKVGPGDKLYTDDRSNGLMYWTIERA
eukprot:TRINITY_DN854_c0_g1_i22.p1 TRINITY_DN854_c0_g1~~TRINITY_DN854_c0_g1_i22.p1  ORF type:complete len:151 (+),score=6.99 TRINITY_DN854_c0_g1_i22:210-662(+)